MRPDQTAVPPRESRTKAASRMPDPVFFAGIEIDKRDLSQLMCKSNAQILEAR
jgi:hypothetical protein